METTPQPVDEHLAGVTPGKRRADAERLVPLFSRVTGQPAQMWGTVVGFGQYHYRYASGHGSHAPAAGFAARRAATTVYLSDGVDAHREQLERLGPHSTGVGCVYLKDLDAIDLDVLADIVDTSYRALTRATWTRRARKGTAES
ncbi:MAG: DUF1801 domain-containing protein [Actinomycetota bacterium]